jgi:hypothetical protein
MHGPPMLGGSEGGLRRHLEHGSMVQEEEAVAVAGAPMHTHVLESGGGKGYRIRSSPPWGSCYRIELNSSVST